MSQYGIINGVGNKKFDPNGNLTLAQVLVLAARTKEYLSGVKIPDVDNSTWYMNSVKYLDEQGVCTPGEFGTDYNSCCNRLTMASLFDRLCEDGSIHNNITSIPDVKNSETYRSIYHLYEQGVLTGNDAYGTFAPYSHITRAQTAAILHRVIDPGCRKSFVLQFRISMVTELRKLYLDFSTKVKLCPAMSMQSTK